MIANRNYLPLLKDQHGGISAIDTGWLLAALERAAVEAGFVEWWLADHVTSSVCSYLGSFYTKNVVGLGRLQEVVRRALEDIGYKEIARCFRAESPACCISLLHCAQDIELLGVEVFFEALASRVTGLHQTRKASFHFYELRACLSYLNAVPGQAVRLEAVDVVGFLRDKIGALQWGREVHCSIS